MLILARVSGTIKEKKKKNEPGHDKTYNKTCVTSKDSDQPVHPPSVARLLFYFSLDSPEAVEGIMRSAKILIRLRGRAG